MCGSENGGKNTRREKKPPTSLNLTARMISLILMQIYHLNCSRAHPSMKSKKKIEFQLFDADNLL